MKRLYEIEPDIPIDSLEEFYSVGAVPDNRPYAYYMFVMTADGVGSFMEKGKAGGYEVAMGHLRGKIPEAAGSLADYRALEFGWATADAVLGASGIIRGEPGTTWDIRIPEFVEYRKQTKGSEQPIKIIYTGRGEVDITEKIFSYGGSRVIIMTTESGREKLLADIERVRSRPSAHEIANLQKLGIDYRDFGPLRTTEVMTAGKEKYIDNREMMRILRQDLDIKVLDLQGGPRAAGSWFKDSLVYALTKEGLVDEYRLTVSPQIIGPLNSEGQRRINPVEGLSLSPEAPLPLELIKIALAGSHVLNRYRCSYDSYRKLVG